MAMRHGEFHRHVTRSIRYVILASLVMATLVATVFVLDLTSGTDASEHPSARVLLSDDEEAHRLATRGRMIEILPRKTISGREVPNRFGGCPENAESTDDCDWSGYGESVAIITAPALGMAVLSLLVLLLFIPFRCCCNCCGGRTASAGCCPATKKKKFRGYTASQIIIVKILVGVLVIGFGVCCAVGYTRNKVLSDGITLFVDTIIGTADDLLLKARSLRNSLLSLDYTREQGNQLTDMIDNVDETLKNARDKRDLVIQFNGWRETGINIIFLVPLSLAVLATLGALVNFPALAMVLGILGWICLPIMWIVFGIHLPVQLVLSDLCNEIDNVLDSSNTGLVNSPSLDFLLSCNNGSAFDEPKQLANDALDRAFAEACDAYGKACEQVAETEGGTMKVLNCVLPPEECGRDTFERTVEALVTDFEYCCVDGCMCPVEDDENCCFRDCPSYNVTLGTCSQFYPNPLTMRNISISRCETECRDTQIPNTSDRYKELAENMVKGVTLFINYTTVLDEKIFPLMNCDFINGAFVLLRSHLCSTTYHGMSGLSATTGTIALLLIPGVILGFLGGKRFNKKNSVAYKSKVLDASSVQMKVMAFDPGAKPQEADYIADPELPVEPLVFETSGYNIQTPPHNIQIIRKSDSNYLAPQVYYPYGQSRSPSPDPSTYNEQSPLSPSGGNRSPSPSGWGEQVPSPVPMGDGLPGQASPTLGYVTPSPSTSPTPLLQPEPYSSKARKKNRQSRRTQFHKCVVYVCVV
eukprot:TRINITY_DN40014_c0_g1_i1.p1 TRINITY_DN40014_c0_g1~~TRINITY_DN40014_c0_g1_i1.p1  ORF type:complete len:781 (-),score=146.08 TRINITY_DN40014_c0_g1_i1:37-2301(-)